MSKVSREVIEAVILAMIVFMVIQTVVRNFKVDGPSMQPTLDGGQYLLVNKLLYLKLDSDRLSRITPFWKVESPTQHFAIRPPVRGEVVVFSYPRDETKDFVKRVVGLPGETVEVRRGTVYIDGEALDEPYLTHRDNSSAREVDLGEDEYYVLGDNRLRSNDSRNWGPVSEDLLLGKVWFVYWPFSELQMVRGAP